MREGSWEPSFLDVARPFKRPRPAVGAQSKVGAVRPWRAGVGAAPHVSARQCAREKMGALDAALRPGSFTEAHEAKLDVAEEDGGTGVVSGRRVWAPDWGTVDEESEVLWCPFK